VLDVYSATTHLFCVLVAQHFCSFSDKLLLAITHFVFIISTVYTSVPVVLLFTLFRFYLVCLLYFIFKTLFVAVLLLLVTHICSFYVSLCIFCNCT